MSILSPILPGDEYPGVDAKTAWYNRNLRIFANLQRITDRTDERILVIIGAGHVPILRHTVQASPEYALVEVADVLGALD
jgi:pheromone shutdown protein TraB